MLSLRRGQHEMRLEIMPLIDVIFLLLTFFIYAMVLMVRLDIVPLDPGTYASAEGAEPVPAIAISINVAGEVLVGREIVKDVEAAVQAARDEVAKDARTIIYVQVEIAEGEMDRLPLFLKLQDSLMAAGMDVNIVSAPE